MLVLLAGLPIVAHALDIGGIFTDAFKFIGTVVKLILGLIVLIWMIYLLVKKK